MPTIKIGKASIDNLCSKKEKDALYWDETLKGFGVKVTPAGTKIYVLQYRAGGSETPTRRFTIGRHGSPWTPAGARTEAERLLLRIANGDDPASAKVQQRDDAEHLAFAPYADRYLNSMRPRWASGTWQSAESSIRRYAVPVLGRKPINAITRRDIAAVLDGLPLDSPALPRNMFVRLCALFAWALERGDIERSPFIGMRRPSTVSPRERILDDRELTPILAATIDVGEPFGSMVRLLLLSGQRRSEVAGLDWSELNRDTRIWLLPAPRVKNRRQHRVPLSDAMITELDRVAGGSWPKRGPIFSTTGHTAVSGFSKMKRRLDELATKHNDGTPLVPWRLHDLRRTMATNLQRLDVRFEVIEELLNHASSIRAGVAGHYQHHDWEREKPVAMKAWADHVATLLPPR